MSLAVGQRIGAFEITGSLGAGGMGEVYRATDTKLKRHVAIKILPRAVASDADRLARFRREAELLASLNHPNIAAIYGFEDASGVHALVLELVEGRTLEELLAAGALPLDVRWPGHIKPGTVCNEMIAHLDWLPTILAVAGDAQVTDKLLKGHKVGDMTYRVHPDGFNLLPLLTGQTDKSPRKSFIYINDEQQVVALRYENWKIVFEEQRAQGTLRIWAEPFTTLRVPKIFNLRTDPYERADITSNSYYDWLMDHVFALVPAQAFVSQFLMTFKEYPQRQKAEAFNLEEVLRKLQESGGSR